VIPTFHCYAVGVPGPQGSKRHVGNGVMIESSKKVAPWREAVKWAAIEAKGKDFKSLEGPLHLCLAFRLHKPSNARKGQLWVPKRPDLSKLIRSTEDALTTAGIYNDDNQVAFITASKTYALPGEPLGCDIQIRVLSEEERP
jgi:crossover junction endodeoxyribonuclease RusA